MRNASYYRGLVIRIGRLLELAILWGSMQLPDASLWQAFRPGARLRTDADEFDVTILHLDPLVVTSGRVAVGDPLVDLYYNEPLSKALPPGRYAVRLAQVTGLDGAALAMIRCGPGIPVRWEPAEPERHGVDSGCSGIIDRKLARKLQRKSSESFERYLNRCTDALQCGDEPWANIRLDRETGGNVLMFRTVDGDGSYPSFLGYSAGGELVCLVTDFFLEDAVQEVRLAGDA